MTPGKSRGTTNRLACALAYWFWESHAEWPQRIQRVYGFREYQCGGRHTWVEDTSLTRTLWRAVGTVFPACKRLWDKIEKKLWDPKPDPNPER